MLVIGDNTVRGQALEGGMIDATKWFMIGIFALEKAGPNLLRKADAVRSTTTECCNNWKKSGFVSGLYKYYAGASD